MMRPLFSLFLICSVLPPIQAQTGDGSQFQHQPPAPAGGQAPAQIQAQIPVPTLGQGGTQVQPLPQAPVPAGGQVQSPVQSPAQAESAGLGLLQRGEALLNEGKLPEAVAVLQEAVAAEPQSAQAFQRLGGAQLMSQDYAGSVESFQRAISLDATNAAAFVGMGMAFLHSGRFGQARAAMVEAKRLDPSKQAKLDEVIAWIDQRVSH
ncbi:MAG: tetratricopeptide repeat protein [Gammaproteobacteria bacterium]|nr:tetratricopeptide repeat protein [Gammaproteobacteria bacterium]